MREKINRLANGIIDARLGEITVNPNAIERIVKAEEIVKIEFEITSNEQIKGVVYSDEYRLKVLTPTFAGSKMRIGLELDTRFLDSGSVLEGNLELVSSIGKVVLPYKFQITNSKTDTVLSDLKRIEDFLLIAKEDAETALRIFEYKDFIKAPFMNNYIYRGLYDGLVSRGSKMFAMEEFLKSIEAKPRTKIQVEDKVYIEEPEQDIEMSIDITKLNWGYIHLIVDTDSDYIKLSDRHISDIEFIDGKREYTFAIIKSKLKKGQNKARIVFSDISSKYTVEVIIGTTAGKSDKKQILADITRALQEDDTVGKPALQVYEEIKKDYIAGKDNIFLYKKYLDLLLQHREFFHNLNDLEVRAFILGLKWDKLDKKMIEMILSRVHMARKLPKSAYRLVYMLYQKYREEDLVEYLAKTIVKTGMRAPYLHKYLKEAVEREIYFENLYEYYLYTLPDEEMPEDTILEYFLNKNIEVNLRIRLYTHILKYMSKEHILYEEYKKEIDKFIRFSLRQSKQGLEYKELYEYGLDESFFDKELSKNLLTMLESYEFVVENEFIKSIVVIYPQLRGEKIYNIENKRADIPIYSEEVIFLFQDIYGNRHSDIVFSAYRLIDRDDLKEKLEEKYLISNHQRLKKLENVLKKDAYDFEDNIYMAECIRLMNLSDGYKHKIYSNLIRNYKNNSKKNPGPENWSLKDREFLFDLDKNMLSRKQRRDVCDTLINLGYVKNAFDMMRAYNIQDIDISNKIRLCERIISEKNIAKDRFLLCMICDLVLHSGYDSAILLDYLCHFYDGSTESMYEILVRAVSERIETYDLEERLLAQMLFSGEYENIDQTFAWYVSRKRGNDIIIKAFFTVKSFEYVFLGKKTGDIVFEHLGNAISIAEDKRNIPELYQLAILKYYSESDILEEEEREIATYLLQNLISKDIIFDFYKVLSRWVTLPSFIMDKSIVMYYEHGKDIPAIEFRRLGTDEGFKREEFSKSYQNMYYAQKLLFEDESLEYRIYDAKNPDLIKREGVLRPDNQCAKHSRFDIINRLEELGSLDNEDVFKTLLVEYVCREAISRQLFDLM